MRKFTSVHIATPYCDNVTMWRCDKQGGMAHAHHHPLIVTMWQCDDVTNKGEWPSIHLWTKGQTDAAGHRKKMLLNKRMYENEKSGSKAAFFVHSQGFEPWTHWLRVSCSTNWAKSARGARQRFDFWFAVAKVHRFFVSTKLFRVFFSKKAKKVLFRGFSRKNT